MALDPVNIVIRARDEASSIFSSISAKMTALGVAVAAYFGINAFVGAVQGAADLEAKLSEVKAASGATAAEMVLLRKAAEDAGASTKFTATEGAEALGNLARAGLTAKDAIAALPAVLTLAQAGGIGLAEASDYLTKAVTGMGLKFGEAARVADVLAAGANASNTSVTGLAQALSYTAPIANSLGLSLETTVAIIGKFADAGIDASRAGTALNAVLAQFADPTSKFRTELANAGITTGNFEKALRQLAAAGPAGAKAINAVGTEAGPALRSLLNQGIGALDDLKGKLDSASGSAAATAKVMEDNLKGSFDGLSSAWDTVKNTLATPVLPVLKSGVDDLSKAFANAVANGTVGKFGDAVATAFTGAIQWIKAFAAEVDFKDLATRLQAFAADMQATFTRIGAAATNAGNVVKLAYGVMAAGTNAVLTAVYGLGVAIGGVFEGFQRGLALLYDGMAKITFGGVSERYRQMAADVRVSADATAAASRAMADKTIESFTDMGDSAQMAREGWAGLTTSTAAASRQASASMPVMQAMADTLTAVGNAAQLAGDKAAAGGDKQKAAAATAQEKVAALRGEYESAVATGNWQLAAEKMQALASAAKEAKTGSADLKKQAAEDAAAIAASFERMGIKTKDELGSIAKTAKTDFNAVKDSGQATSEGLQAAFKKYAEAAIAANGGVASAALKAEAAVAKISITTDAAGKVIVSAMDKGAAAIKGVEDAYRQLGQKTPLELSKIAEANAAAWDLVKADTEASLETLQGAFTTYAQSAIAAAGNVGSQQRATTEELLKQEAALKGLSVSFDENGKMVVQTQAEAADAIGRTTGALHGQRDAVDSVTSALERQNAALERAYAAKEKAIALENKRLNRDAEGYSLNTKGERVQTEVQSQRSVYELARQQGLTDAQALQIAEQFFKNGRQSGGEGANTSLGENWFTELQKAIDRLLLANAKARADAERAENAGNPQAAPGRSGSSASAAGSLNVGTPEAPGQHLATDKTVNVRLILPNGTVQNVPTSEDGSVALLAALRSAKLSAGI